MQVLFLTGNESGHNFFVSRLINYLGIDNFFVYKHHSGISNDFFFTRLYSKQSMLTHEEEYLRNFITERNKGFSEYGGMVFDNEQCFTQIDQFNAELDFLMGRERFDYIFSYGSPIIHNSDVLSPNQKSVNFHFGLSRYYRGGSTNIYALANNEYEKVGLTAHKLERNVDSGGILFEIMPIGEPDAGAILTIAELSEYLLRKAVLRLVTIVQNNNVEYSTGNYATARLVFNRNINIESIMSAEINLKKAVANRPKKGVR